MGKLVYLTITCPNITYSVGLLSQFMHSPKEIHWQATLCVLTYLKHASSCGLLYLQHGHLCVEAYFDSSYARNRGDRKSISWYCTLVGKSLVMWQSQKQHVVSLYSSHAEYQAMTHASFEILWVHSFLHKLGFPVHGAMPMHCDNEASTFLANNTTFHEHTNNPRLIVMLFIIGCLMSPSPLLMLALPIISLAF